MQQALKLAMLKSMEKARDLKAIYDQLESWTKWLPMFLKIKNLGWFILQVENAKN
jgi:hypothetical protein